MMNMAEALALDHERQVLSDVHVVVRPHIADEGGPDITRIRNVTRFTIDFPATRGVLPLKQQAACRDHDETSTGEQGERGDDGRWCTPSADMVAESGMEGDDKMEAFIDEDGDVVIARETNAPHERDVISIEHAMATSLSDVGLQVWAGCLLMCNFILHNRQRFAGCIALEMGGGTGLGSIVMATTAKIVICTDRGPDTLAVCQRNVNTNAHLFTGSDTSQPESRVIVRELDWMERSLRTGTDSQFDWKPDEVRRLNDVSIIFAADVIYSNDLTDAFFQKLPDLMKMGNPKTCFIATEKRLNFTLAELDVTCKEYDHFRMWLSRLERRLGFSVTRLPTEFPRYLHCSKSPHLELWEVSVR